jgi:hypothetical protein
MTLNALAILTAVEQCCLGTIGTVEVVPASTFLRGAYGGVSDEKLAHDARVKSLVEVEWKTTKDAPGWPRSSPHQKLELELLIRIAFTTDLEIDADRRRATRAACVQAAEAARNAVTRPANLVQTLAAVPTELTDGCLTDAVLKVVREDFPARIYVVEIAAKARACTTRAVA